ncbi:MAG: transposase [Simplicispira sp.]|nr:transposase [Simplicispira sp.]
MVDLLQVAGLPRSTFYYQCQASQRADQQSALEARIRTVYDEHKGRYGYRRITAALCNSVAEPVNHKCVHRLMRKMGLRALIRAKKRSRHVLGVSDAHVPNVLQRDFRATALTRSGQPMSPSSREWLQALPVGLH